jgi:N,N'-diacetyllegionaminate synthase
MNVLCVIPARGGSKGIPDKNLREVGGISLVGRAVLSARAFVREAGLESASIVVDTDAEAIAAEGRSWGAAVPFLRPGELARDDTPTSESTLALLDRLAPDGVRSEAVVLLQPTSPLRTGADIAACWKLFDLAGAQSVISLAETPHPLELGMRLDAQGAVAWLAESGGGRRRQEYAPAYWPSGAVYVISAGLLRERRSFIVPGVTRGVVLSAERSVDVDRPHDLVVAQAMLEMVPVQPVQLGRSGIGPGHRCFVIAEAGVNHNGSAELAHNLVDAAADAGADAVKFQTFDADLVVAADAPKAAYQIANTGGAESQRDMLRRLALPRREFTALFRHAADRGLLFLSTPFDDVSADFLEDLGVSAFKVPSGEITNLPFLARLAGKGRPLLVSTGMSRMAEVNEAVETVRAAGDPPLALFHCVTNYPADPADCNLRAMDTMRRAFRVPVGWSDHTEGIPVSLAAVAAGAEVLEKHFTLDRTLPGPDHAASLEPSELRELIESCRAIEGARGSGRKVPAASEAANAALVRRSLHAARELLPGEVLSSRDMVALRPGTGIAPGAKAELVGRTLRARVRPGEMLSEDHLA